MAKSIAAYVQQPSVPEGHSNEYCRVIGTRKA